MNKILLYIILPTLILIGLGIFWYNYRPFIICPEGYSKTIWNFAGKTKFCENEKGEKLGIYYDRNTWGEVRLDIYKDNEVINHKYYDRTGHLFEECYQENGLRKCISYYDGNFNFVRGIKNFFNGIWSRYNTGSIDRIEYQDKKYNNQGPYYTYYENGNLSISGSFYNGLKTGLWLFFDENGNISNREIY